MTTQQPQKGRRRSPFMDFVLGGTATATACIFTNPLEVVKTRLQLQGELAISEARPYKNVFQAFYHIGAKEGLRGLQRGLVPGIMYQMAMNGVRLGTFDQIKRAIGADDPHTSNLFLKELGAGAIAGVLGASVGSPLFLVKTRLQSQSNAISGVGHQHKITGMMDGLRQIYKAEGVKGLYRGVTASQLRVSIGSAVQLSTYGQMKGLIGSTGIAKEGSFLLYFLSSFATGFVVAVFMNPIDVSTTRLYNQAVSAEGKGLMYSGLFDCLRKTVRSEGPAALLKGVSAQYLRIGPHTVLTFLVWEYLKKLASKYDL